MPPVSDSRFCSEPDAPGWCSPPVVVGGAVVGAVGGAVVARGAVVAVLAVGGAPDDAVDDDALYDFDDAVEDDAVDDFDDAVDDDALDDFDDELVLEAPGPVAVDFPPTSPGWTIATTTPATSSAPMTIINTRS